MIYLNKDKTLLTLFPFPFIVAHVEIKHHMP